jgi:calmodulin
MAYRKISWKLENCNKLENEGNVELGKLRRLFFSLDRNGKGKTSIYGLGSVLKDPSLQMSEDAIAAFITDFHVDRTGTEDMDICEFFDMIEVKNFSDHYFKQLIHKAIIRQTAIRNDFRKYDQNGDGCITTKQFRVVMRKQKIMVTEEEIDTMIKDADYDMNGKLNYEEFSLVITE